MNNVLLGHYKFPEGLLKLGTSGVLSGAPGFFSFGDDVTCFGRMAQGHTSANWNSSLPIADPGVRMCRDQLLLPFDLSEVVSNLTMERYCADAIARGSNSGSTRAIRKIYYALRPLLNVSVRKHLQRINLNGWDKIGFPHWPVDFSVENLYERVLALWLERTGTRELPFIWFWPDGHQASVIMTHDIEGIAGQNFCEQLMSIDESFGIRSAFQVVPEARYANEPVFLERFRQRGFEINVHDLNHDGALFGERQEFSRRAALINNYARTFGTRGFRAGAMYRRQDWYEAFDLAYDMSVPNVAHLEPQRGGCCTSFPYFIGNILELPLTTIQDYSLFHILGDHSIELWKRQIELISKRNGLISFIVHPDYITEEREQRVYRDLLTHITASRDSLNFWLALPGEVDRWWRSRDNMKLVEDGTDWRVEGEGSERARVAFARLQDGRITYRQQ